MSVFSYFVCINKEQTEIAESYELRGSYEMAYLALWAITEHTVKEVESRAKTRKLKNAIDEWHKYFQSNEELKRPKQIKNFACDVKTIPQIKTLTEELGDIPAVSKLLQTKEIGKSTKYRDKRNAIAHKAEKFSSETVYKDYKVTALSAIQELERKLNKVEYK
jgi:hypothetical protein